LYRRGAGGRFLSAQLDSYIFITVPLGRIYSVNIKTRDAVRANSYAVRILFAAINDFSVSSKYRYNVICGGRRIPRCSLIVKAVSDSDHRKRKRHDDTEQAKYLCD
jgi:hypothetical protein